MWWAPAVRVHGEGDLLSVLEEECIHTSRGKPRVPQKGNTRATLKTTSQVAYPGSIPIPTPPISNLGYETPFPPRLLKDREGGTSPLSAWLPAS